MTKQYMTIDGYSVAFTDEKNVLDVVRKAGIELPTFCYYSELSVYGACRMCMVEDDNGRVFAACSTPPAAGMSIHTHTPRLQEYRKMILELLLASHCQHNCTTCDKNNRCRLQKLASRFNIRKIRFENHEELYPVDDSSLAIVRDPNKCILCGDCVRVCSEIQNVGAIDFAYRGSRMIVSPAFNKPLAATNCVHCGQCAAVCPTGAIVVKKDDRKVWEAIHDPQKKVVAQIAPAVRVALGSQLGFPEGENTMGKIVAALRKIGFDEIFDTTMGADLTVEEESKEWLERLQNKGKLPLFTSCCPAWVQYVEKNHPELLGNISTCRSPQQMFGAVIKAYQRKYETDDREVFLVSIMPCTAKKFEAARPEFQQDGIPDVDCVITTQELVNMIKEAGLVMEEIEPEATDMPFGMASGAGVIFGVTGGVTEAVIRRVVSDHSAAALSHIAVLGERGLAGVKEFDVTLGDVTYHLGVVSGLGNAEKLLDRMARGEVSFDFVEVMACPNGCIGGGGQPFALQAGKEKRGKGLYAADKLSQIKRTQENPVLHTLYEDILSGDAPHRLLHTKHIQ